MWSIVDAITFDRAYLIVFGLYWWLFTEFKCSCWYELAYEIHFIYLVKICGIGLSLYVFVVTRWIMIEVYWTSLSGHAGARLHLTPFGLNLTSLDGYLLS